MKDPNWALVHFEELPLSKGELAHVPEDSLALFAISSFATSELNTIARVMLSAIHSSERDDAINLAALMQQFCVLRVWTLKLFEFHKCLKLLARGKDKSNNEVRCLASDRLKVFESELKLDASYSLARDVRNEAAGHYSFSAAKKNLEFVKAEGTASMFVNRRVGNSFYPFGEEVMFIGRLNRHGSRKMGVQDTAELSEKLFHWNKLANSWVHETHQSVFRGLIAPLLPGRYKYRRVFWVLPKKVGSLEDFNVPLFGSRDLGNNS